MSKTNSGDEFNCRVCGMHQQHKPWGEDGKTPSFNICACCGTEFGYEDNILDAIREQRKKWILSGAAWFNSKRQPGDWNLETQMTQIPEEYK